MTEYATSDLCEIAYLFCKGADLSHTDQQGERVMFYFENREACKTLIKDIKLGKDMVSLSQAMSVIRRARGIMHNQ